MTPDALDDLLNGSAPATRTADPADLRLMITSARTQARSRRRTVAAITAGAVAVLLASGAGVATANSDWLWGPGMENPARSFAYESPTWGQCELRFGSFVTANPLDQLPVDRVIDDWFATADLQAEAAPLITQYLAQIEAWQAEEDEPITDPRLADLNYWQAADQAVGELLDRELKSHGYDGAVGTGLSSSAGQVHCEGEQWG